MSSSSLDSGEREGWRGGVVGGEWGERVGAEGNGKKRKIGISHSTLRRGVRCRILNSKLKGLFRNWKK